jgi:hypothetical protein
VTSTSSGAYWKPSVGATWQIELSDTITDTTYNADVFDVNLFDIPVSIISTLHTNGKKVICYFSAGGYENWRPDQSEFLPSDKGNPLDGWPGEWWLNTSSSHVRSTMTNRIILAVTNVCDGVDPDNIDGYDNDNDTAIDYITFLANEAHSRDLAIGLKNAAEIVSSVLSNVEWQVNEPCLQYDECDVFQPFIDAGKPVFHIEYPSDAPDVSPGVKAENCGAVSVSGLSTVLKTTNLDAWIDPY